MTIGHSIRYHRKRLKLTQVQLAEILDVTPQAVSRWENGTGLPDITMAVPLARALGTTTDELLRFGQRYQEFEDRWRDTLQSQGDNPHTLLPVALDALTAFPRDAVFLFRAAVSCERIAEFSDNPQESMDYISRALAYAQLHDEMDPDGPAYCPNIRDKVTLNPQGFYVLKSGR